MSNNKPNDGRETIAFEFKHPVNGETHTVSVSMEEIAHHMCEVLFEKLCGEFCQCEPVGETNVVDCRCDEYADEFERVKSYAQPADQQGEPVAWAYMKKGPESYSAPRPFLVWASEDIDVMRQGLKTGDHVHYVPRPDLYDWRPLFYGHAQPATAKVVLPEERTRRTSDIRDEAYDNGYNECIADTAKLNEGRV